MELETLALSAFVAAVVSGLIAWPLESLKAWLKRPKLDIGEAEFHDADGVRYFYLQINNNGKTTARNCVGQLSLALLDVEAVLDGGLVTKESLEAGGTASLSNVAVAWQRADCPIGVDVHPSQGQRLELAAGELVHPKEYEATTDTFEAAGGPWTLFFLPTEVAYKRLRVRFRGRGLRFTAKVGADNAAPAYRFGEILSGEHGDLPTIRLLKSLPPGIDGAEK